MSGIRITSIGTQNYIYNNGQLRGKLKVASSTQDFEVQKTIADSKDIRILVALASNKDLHPEVEKILAEKNNYRITNSLLNRTA